MLQDFSTSTGKKGLILVPDAVPEGKLVALHKSSKIHRFCSHIKLAPDHGQLF